MSEGDDSAFYLAKGFNVIGVEADTKVVESVSARFATEILEGRLTVFNRAASSSSEQTLTFYRNEREQGHSSLSPDHSVGDKTVFHVKTINWSSLMLMAAEAPYYVKVDIEGAEEPFLASMIGANELPEFMSVECHTFRPIEMLYRIGFRKFKLVNQTSFYRFALPNPALEGTLVEQPQWRHSSGPFGRELPPGPWLDISEVAVIWNHISHLRPHHSILAPTWFDCHATNLEL